MPTFMRMSPWGVGTWGTWKLLCFPASFRGRTCAVKTELWSIVPSTAHRLVSLLHTSQWGPGQK